LFPWVTDCDPGVAATEKSGAGAGFTTRVTEAVCVVVPLVPVMVNGKLPVGVVLLVVIVSVELPEVSGVGLNVPLAPAGNPLTVRSTLPVNPPLGVTVTV
jgi:hypothetical protein